MDHDGLTTGAEWIVDARGCVGDALRRLSSVLDFCDLVIRELSLKVVGEPHWHQFDAPGGVTGLYLLTESHLAVHTFPELGLITLNLYCCRPRREFEWTAAMELHFGATDVRVIRIARGGLPVGDVSDPDDSISRSGIRQNSLTADDRTGDACGLPLNEVMISERPPHPALSPAGERELNAPNMAITQEAQG